MIKRQFERLRVPVVQELNSETKDYDFFPEQRYQV